MAWRPYDNLIEGELDNTVLGKVTGWIKFVGLPEPVKLDLAGDFHRDIRGAKIRFRNPTPREEDTNGPYVTGLSTVQTGRVGDITAGLPPHDYVRHPYIEWYSEENGRIVIELEPGQLEVVGKPIPALESDPISRETQEQNMARFMTSLVDAVQQQNKGAAANTRTGPTNRIRLLPQQRTGTYKFSGQFVVTRNAVGKFGERTALAAYAVVRREVASNGGMDSFQVLDIDGEKLWLIDDGSVVTALLPEDY